MNENVKENGREKLGDIVETALNSIKEIADVNTVVGEPINTANGVTIIPVTNVSVGFASGGVDNLGKRTTEKSQSVNFAGGGGTGIKITPVGFLVVKPNGEVSFLGMSAPQKPDKIDSVFDLIERSPDIIKKFKATFAKDKPEAAPEVSEEAASDEKTEETAETEGK
ncbi:MAG: sporulation protein YtfJ [Ruminococcaceae bacterium]|nr:sporulation protein YtfJ [Oscillospiraceae bacterium]